MNRLIKAQQTFQNLIKDVIDYELYIIKALEVRFLHYQSKDKLHTEEFYNDMESQIKKSEFTDTEAFMSWLHYEKNNKLPNSSSGSTFAELTNTDQLLNHIEEETGFNWIWNYAENKYKEIEIGYWPETK